MIDLARRWWRWLTNPDPLPGQLWKLDGVGIVRILDWDWSSSVRYGTVRYETSTRAHIVERGRFLSQATPYRPNANDILNGDFP